LAIVGRGPLLPDLQQRARELGVESRVMFLGVRSDVEALLSAADGFVLSSAWEGMPNVVMEALAAGVPVVATQVGGVTELVEEGESGLLVRPRDPEALSQRMRELMSLTSEQRQRMGLRGRDHIVASYSLQAMADRWLKLYQQLLISKGLVIQP
jgi:glycosyltransferase involved in cell wall biosynthesis